VKLAAALVASILSLTTLDARSALPSDDAYTVTVKFADLDLDREAGVAKLYARIRGAARRVCDQQAIDQPWATDSHPVCVKRAVSTAVARINRPTLTEYFAQLGSQPAKTATASVAAR
jgi:UrcA family protein